MELHYLSATEALKKFKNKTLSPLELTKAVIDRAEKLILKQMLIILHSMKKQ